MKLFTSGTPVIGSRVESKVSSVGKGSSKMVSLGVDAGAARVVMKTGVRADTGVAGVVLLGSGVVRVQSLIPISEPRRR